MDRKAWWATVHGMAELDTTEKQAHFPSPKSSPATTDEWGVCRHSEEGAE